MKRPSNKLPTVASGNGTKFCHLGACRICKDLIDVQLLSARFFFWVPKVNQQIAQRM